MHLTTAQPAAGSPNVPANTTHSCTGSSARATASQQCVTRRNVPVLAVPSARRGDGGADHPDRDTVVALDIRAGYPSVRTADGHHPPGYRRRRRTPPGGRGSNWTACRSPPPGSPAKRRGRPTGGSPGRTPSITTVSGAAHAAARGPRKASADSICPGPSGLTGLDLGVVLRRHAPARPPAAGRRRTRPRPSGRWPTRAATGHAPPPSRPPSEPAPDPPRSSETETTGSVL